MLGMEQCLDRVEWDERLEKGLPIGRRDIREFKKPQQRHKGHQLKKKYIYFTYESHDALKSFTFVFCLSLSKLYYRETKSGTQWEI